MIPVVSRDDEQKIQDATRDEKDRQSKPAVQGLQRTEHQVVPLVRRHVPRTKGKLHWRK